MTLTSQRKQYVKVYRIDIAHYELVVFKTNIEKINFIIDKHKENTENIDNPDFELDPILYGNLNYALYTYSLKEKPTIWNTFYQALSKEILN